MCALSTCLRVGLGVAQWIFAQGERKYNGTSNGLKLLMSFLILSGYIGLGLYSSVYEPLNAKQQPSSSSSQLGASTASISARGGTTADRPIAQTRSSAILSTMSRAVGAGVSSTNAVMKRKTVMHTRYLMILFALLSLYSAYLVKAFIERVGKTEVRQPPMTVDCSFGLWDSLFYTNSGVIIILASLYVVLSFSNEFFGSVVKGGGGCVFPRGREGRKLRRAAAAKRNLDEQRRQAQISRKERLQAELRLQKLRQSEQSDKNGPALFEEEVYDTASTGSLSGSKVFTMKNPGPLSLRRSSAPPEPTIEMKIPADSSSLSSSAPSQSSFEVEKQMQEEGTAIV